MRVTIQALAGVLGGTQSLHTNSYDEALALPSEEAVTVALRTQQIIAEESGAANTVDPLAGSYFVEALTDKMEADALDYIRRIDEMGGMISAIAAGFPQKEIADAAYRYQRQTDKGEKIIVGVNRYEAAENRKLEILKIGELTEREQTERLQRVRDERDELRVEAALAALRLGAEESTNLIPLMLDAVREYASVGEVCQALVPVFGVYRETSVI